MYQDAIANIKNSIFPIFSILKEGNNITMGVSGTGFFISPNGYFLTALHVINEAPLNSTFEYRGNIPDHIVNPPVAIQEIYRDPIRDIFLGKIDITDITPVTFSLEKPKVGKSVCLCGYPLAQLSINPNGNVDVSAVRQYWQPTFIIDSITAIDQGRNYTGFMTQDTSLNGMSGSPVFDLDGIVYGIDAAFITREIPQKDQSTIKVYNGVVIDNTSISDIYNMIHE